MSTTSNIKVNLHHTSKHFLIAVDFLTLQHKYDYLFRVIEKKRKNLFFSISHSHSNDNIFSAKATTVCVELAFHKN